MLNDLTTGSVFKKLFFFSLPILGSVVFQQLYNMADTIIAGQFIGEDALASCGASYPLTMLFMGVALGCNLGCGVIVSRFYGEKNYVNVKQSISTILISVTILGIVLSLFGFFGASFMLNMINTPINIFNDSLDYFKIYMLGFAFILLYNVGTGIFSALGNSKTPFYFLVFSSVSNVLLDLLFVLVFNMGVKGLALATLIAQSFSALAIIFYLFIKLKEIKVDEKYKLFSKKLLISMLVVAIPSIIQQSFISIGNVLIQNVINNYGSNVVAGYTAAIKLNTFVVISVTTLGGAISSFTAQNLGAGNIKRIKSGVNASIIMILCLVLPFTLFYCLFPDIGLKLFMKDISDVALKTGRNFLYVVSPFYAVISLKLIFDAVLRGSACMKKFLVATFFSLFLRVAFCYIFDFTLGLKGIWWSWPIGWIVACIISAIFYYDNKWYKKYNL